MRDRLVRGFVLLGAVMVMSASGCVATRGTPSSQRTLEAMRAAVESGATPEQRLAPGERKDAITRAYVLHASGRVQCGGFLRKKQTAFFHAWATHPGPDGERVDVPTMKLSFTYLEGLFAGAERSTGSQLVEQLSLDETITGPGDFCSCIYGIAEATLLNATRVQVKQRICPE